MADREQAVGILVSEQNAEEERIVSMQNERRNLKRQQQDLTRQIKNEARKRQRLLQRAKCLSEADLLTVLGSRVRAKSKAKAKAKAAAH